MNDDFGVGIGAEGMAQAKKFLAQLAKIIDFAVVNDGQGSRFVPDRLAATGQIDDAEAPRAKDYRRRVRKPSSSGPRWTIAASMRRTTASPSSLELNPMAPQIPHMAQFAGFQKATPAR